MTPDEASIAMRQHAQARAQLKRTTEDLYESIRVRRDEGDTWQSIGDVSGLGGRQAAKLWFVRETERRKERTQ